MRTMLFTNSDAHSPEPRGLGPAATPAPQFESPGGILDTTDHLACRQILEALSEGVYVTDLDRRIIYWSAGAERISGFPASSVFGAKCSDNILMHVDEEGVNLCQSLCPLAKTMIDGEPRQAHVYLHHSEGHRVPVTVCTSALRDSGGLIVAGIETFNEGSRVETLRERIRELEVESVVDELTSLPNRRYVERTLERRLGELGRYDRQFGVLFVDIDHFKDVNDTYGHEAGDRVLKMVGSTLARTARLFDVVGRWGGEEFVDVVAAVSEEGLVSAARRVRKLTGESWLMVDHNKVSVNVSVGATMAREGDTPESLVDRADRLMYLSKQRGRNRVSTDEDGRRAGGTGHKTCPALAQSYRNRVARTFRTGVSYDSRHL